MQEEQSIFEIFQDPLLTIVALIMLGTLWIVVPRPGEADKSGSHAAVVEIEQIKQQISMLNSRIEDLQKELERLMALLTGAEASAVESDQAARRKLQDLLQEVARARAEVEDLQQRLKTLREKLDQARTQGEDARLVADLEAQIQRLQQELAVKQAQLKQLEQELQRFVAANQQAEREQHAQAGRMDELRRRLQMEKAALQQLEAEKAKLEKALEDRPGFAEYSLDIVKNKEPVFFEADGNLLSAINEKNYDMNSFPQMISGRMATVVKIERKKSAITEPVGKLAEVGSQFQQELKKLNKQKSYVVFLVRKDSFEVFRQAREIAWRQGLQVGWQPCKDGPIYASSAGEATPASSGGGGG